LLLSKQLKNPIESKKINEDETKKKLKKKRNKKQSSSGESLKSKLISQTHNPLNSIAELNQEAQHSTNLMLNDEINEFN
jgi:hypothetical protein